MTKLKFSTEPLFHYSKSDNKNNFIYMFLFFLVNYLKFLNPRKYFLVAVANHHRAANTSKKYFIRGPKYLDEMVEIFDIKSKLKITHDLIIVTKSKINKNMEIICPIKKDHSLIYRSFLLGHTFVDKFIYLFEASKYFIPLSLSKEQISKINFPDIVSCDPANPLVRNIFINSNKSKSSHFYFVLVTHLSKNPIEWHSVSKKSHLIILDKFKKQAMSLLGEIKYSILELDLAKDKSPVIFKWNCIFFLQWYSQEAFASPLKYWLWMLKYSYLATSHGGVVKLHPNMGFFEKFIFKFLSTFLINLSDESLESLCLKSRFAISHSSGANNFFEEITNRRSFHLKSKYEK